MNENNNESVLPSIKDLTGTIQQETGFVDVAEAVMGPTTKEIMIGVGVLIALSVIFFFIRNAFVNYLVGSLKRSPNNASIAGWGIFGGLFFSAVLGCIALISFSLLTIAVTIPLALVSLVCFVIALMTAMKK